MHFFGSIYSIEKGTAAPAECTKQSVSSQKPGCRQCMETKLEKKKVNNRTSKNIYPSDGMEVATVCLKVDASTAGKV